MSRLVADVGNSRLKWGRLRPAPAGPEDQGDGPVPGPLAETCTLPLDDPGAWTATLQRWGCSEAEPGRWAIASVNPPLAGRLGEFLAQRGIQDIRWYRSAAEVPVRHSLEPAETAGADRALAVLAAQGLQAAGGAGRPGLVVSCGSAIVVDWVSAEGVWQGGAIGPGLGLSARALHLLTAQLPLVAVPEAPPAWGRATEPALAAGLFWGTVGALRELLARQAAGLEPAPWVVWTGGDAPMLAPQVAWEGSRVVPDLVLLGLAQAAFGQSIAGSPGVGIGTRR